MKGAETILNSIDIQKILPHRYPFLLVDKVTDMDEDKTITGIKNVTVNEPFFQGHFPGNPIMPGVLQCEALAQLTGVLLLSKEENKGKLGVFTGINNFKFRKQIVPGDTLVMQSEILKYRHGMAVAKAQITVDGKVACMGEISFAVLDNPANEV